MTNKLTTYQKIQLELLIEEEIHRYKRVMQKYTKYSEPYLSYMDRINSMYDIAKKLNLEIED